MKKTATFGGQDAIAAVKEIVGNVEKFDFQKVSDLLPQVDLPDLEPFFVKMLAINNRRVTHTEQGIGFKTPDNWRNEPGILREYEDLHFQRHKRSDNSVKTLAVGHKIFNQSLKQALEFQESVASFPGLKYPLFIFQIIDRVTGTKTNAQQIIVGVELLNFSVDNAKILKDWEIIHQLNEYLKLPKTALSAESPAKTSIATSKIITLINKSHELITNNLSILNLPFQIPKSQAIAIFYPSY